MQPRPNCVSLIGLDPSGAGTKEFWVEKDLIQFYYKKNWMDKFKGLYLVKEVLESPAVIFQGRRDQEALALCYAGVPSCRYSRAGNRLPRPPGMTFMVYIREDDVITDWDWEKADKSLTYPHDYLTRLGPQLWPKT